MELEFKIREAFDDDAEAIAHVHMASIIEMDNRFYDRDTIAYWAAPRNGSQYVNAMGFGERFFVAEDLNGNLLGFSSAGNYRVPHVAVYVRRAATRIGVGSQLLRAAEQVLRERGCTEIRIDASLNAEPFYARHGFESLEQGDHMLSSGGVMRCVRMVKELI